MKEILEFHFYRGCPVWQSSGPLQTDGGLILLTPWWARSQRCGGKSDDTSLFLACSRRHNCDCNVRGAFAAFRQWVGPDNEGDQDHRAFSAWPAGRYVGTTADRTDW